MIAATLDLLRKSPSSLEQLLKAEMLDPECESVNVPLAKSLRRKERYESACQHSQRAFGYNQ